MPSQQVLLPDGSGYSFISTVLAWPTERFIFFQDGHDDLGRRHRVHSLQLELHRRVVPELLRATARHGRFSPHETAAALLSMFATVVQP